MNSEVLYNKSLEFIEANGAISKNVSVLGFTKSIPNLYQKMIDPSPPHHRTCADHPKLYQIQIDVRPETCYTFVRFATRRPLDEWQR